MWGRSSRLLVRGGEYVGKHVVIVLDNSGLVIEAQDLRVSDAM